MIEIGIDYCEGADMAVYSIRDGSKIIPWPDGYPEDGDGVRATIFEGKPVCVHPCHYPYMYVHGQWERI